MRLPPALWWWRGTAWLVAGAPLAVLVTRIAQNDLGPNPVEFLEHHSGEWGLRLLLLTLAMTPLRQLTKRAEPLRVRRLLGLWAYVWICLHFSIYLVFDIAGSLPALAEDLVDRRYITVGFLAWLLLLPLAITSTQAWQRRLQRRWQRLHRLIYPAAGLGCLHFVWLVKSDLREPLLYSAILLTLLALRPGWRLKLHGILRARSPAPPPP